MAKKLTMNQFTNMIVNFDKNSPEMARKIVNKMAWQARTEIKKEYTQGSNKFTLRNEYTNRMMQVKQCPENTDIANAEATTYTKAEYMGYHETGKSLTTNLWGNNNKQGSVPLPTLDSRGGSNYNTISRNLRFDRLGNIGKHIKGRGYKNGMSPSSTGAFLLKPKNSKSLLIMKRLANRRLDVIRMIVKQQPIRKKEFFKRGTETTLKSNELSKHIAYEIKSNLL